MQLKQKIQTDVLTLGEKKISNPFKYNQHLSNKRILHNPFIDNADYPNLSETAFQVAGVHEKIYFEPKKVKAGIVTCGGICPGINNVIRSIVMCLWNNYDCQQAYGFRYGLQGFIDKYGHDLMHLTPEIVLDIHNQGGTILGTSRGSQPPEDIVDRLEFENFNQIFFIGGNGTLQAAGRVYEEIARRNLDISVMAIPKTIDNDIMYVTQSFGFDTAVDVATNAIKSAYIEAKSSPNGIGLVKLMGRNSGFIAATASVAQRNVNYVLIPEVPFQIDGENGLLNRLKHTILQKNYAVVVVAEGAGQDLIQSNSLGTDASGNPKLKDIGFFLKDRIGQFFKDEGVELNLKYIDPSYLIRSVPSNTHDNIFTALLGQYAAHAAMAGFTNALISWWHGVYCIIPMNLASSGTKIINPSGRLWQNVIESTGQPDMY